MDQLMAFCRPGFETEAGRELVDAAMAEGIFGYFEPGKDQGLVRFILTGHESAPDLLARVRLDDLVFVRDWFVVLATLDLPIRDRVGAVIEALRGEGLALPEACRVEVRVLENNTDRDLGNFARKWVAPLSRALRGAGLLKADPDAGAEARLDILLPNFSTAIVGLSLAGNRARWLGGAPRLRLPAAAPSRSALKLEEAWKVFLPAGRELDYLGGGKKAVDLGAAPGGWTWQLVRQGMRVVAVDNGPMDPGLMASGLVEHVRADGYRWRPRRGVDWMVCDIVDQPRKSAALAVTWLAERLCRYTVFNLKLPMKQRYEEWLLCRERIEQGLAEADIGYRMRARHLYHDREEITCFIERLD
ncbi:23S rRNA (cytidine(2498)-2'-O)-methyltransferase RlmM [Marinobacter lutaoensis]|uniref:Ribosomal RNA large subunit methyltransferase M n=1 Tax=Marinobacter lutaoensis TaxID=135739 RepID=A0A1V2DXS2_9GAMM|nr:23S rRNA (cytidine(2498)-2'-O)-methyltransferase RlmM [Marinobacter lutaoensis]ONF45327.1 23S rRNA (cytidine(2498)-2'-O)-methyltransferase RlmM [Marinobacter lutaoensis]